MKQAMPAETSIPCSREARDLVRKAKGEDESYDEYLKRVFSAAQAVRKGTR
jgi:hypothetical protein